MAEEENHQCPTPQPATATAVALNWATSWLGKQETSTVILLGILIAIGYGGFQAMTVHIPLHLKTIQDGYKEISAEDRQARREDMKSVSDSIKTLVESQDKEREALIDLIKNTRSAMKTGSKNPVEEHN